MLLGRRVGKIWRACDSPFMKNSTSHLFWRVQTWSKLFTTGPTCSHLFTTVYTPETTLFAQLQFLVEFSPWESCYFSILRAILLKLHIFAHLIESYRTVYGLSSCIEIIMSIPLAAHTTVTMYARYKMSFFCTFEGFYFSFLRPILLKLNILAPLIESFPTLYGLWSCIEIEMSISLGAHS